MERQIQLKELFILNFKIFFVMVKKYLCYLFIVLSVSYFLGCEAQQASYLDTGFGGTIIDSSTKRGIQGVSITIDQLKFSTVTDSNGFFYVGKIGVPSSAGNYGVSCTKTGYDPVNFNVVLYAGDTTKRFNFAMYNRISNTVFIAKNLVVSEYFNKKSLSMINLYSLFVTDDSIWYDIDAVLLDSSKTRSNFTFHAGGYAQPITGNDTRFTPLLGYYSQYDFDTLSRIDVGPRNINPNTDFPTQITQSFNAPLTQNPVYGFYLLSRHNWDPSYPRVYGLLRIDSFYLDNVSNSYKAVVDIKINRNEQNYFLLN
jgi:hypothetical protein